MNNLNQGKSFIFNSTPGSGKTSVIIELEKLDHAVIHEAGTPEASPLAVFKALLLSEAADSSFD